MNTVTEHEVVEMLKFKMSYGPTSWVSSDASSDTISWEPREKLANCEEAIAAAFKRSSCRTLLLPAQHPPHVSTSLPPTGFTVVMPPPDLGMALVGRQRLYWWQDDGWQHGTVACLSPRPAFSHVVA
jgi:hypothetical protein